MNVAITEPNPYLSFVIEFNDGEIMEISEFKDLIGKYTWVQFANDIYPKIVNKDAATPILVERFGVERLGNL